MPQTQNNNKEKLINYAKKVIEIECSNLENIRERIGEDFTDAVNAMLQCKGKVIVTGMGKSGIIGRKIAGTFASIGTPSIFLHPGDAVHGDLGMVSQNDIVIIISNSGETDEITRIIPSVKKIGAFIISLTSSVSSCIGMQSDITISTGEIEEADTFGIIPSSSTTCALVLGDALALTLMAAKGVQKEDFAFFHPAGNLGKRLMLKVKDVMATGDKIPMVDINSKLTQAIKEIDDKNLGLTLVVNQNKVVEGILTDGDIRRFLIKKTDISGALSRNCMTPNPKTIDKENLAIKALEVMEKMEITSLVILNKNGTPKGVVHLHDLLGKKEFKVGY
ncbi:KpsF/GutQ family sugar-phosphate isomerase [bacterium]|nr:KpsF/GutQ family sugar-phosphate isomerase [bacterium]